MSKEKKEKVVYNLLPNYDTPYLHVLLSHLNHIKDAIKLVRMQVVRKTDGFERAAELENSTDISIEDEDILTEFYVEVQCNLSVNDKWVKLNNSYNKVLYQGDEPLYVKILNAAYGIEESEVLTLSGSKVEELLQKLFLELAETI